jgi:hypothetical protein
MRVSFCVCMRGSRELLENGFFEELLLVVDYEELFSMVFNANVFEDLFIRR